MTTVSIYVFLAFTVLPYLSTLTTAWKINRLYTYETVNVDGVFKEVRGFVPEDFVFKEFEKIIKNAWYYCFKRN